MWLACAMYRHAELHKVQPNLSSTVDSVALKFVPIPTADCRQSSYVPEEQSPKKWPLVNPILVQVKWCQSKTVECNFDSNDSSWTISKKTIDVVLLDEVEAWSSDSSSLETVPKTWVSKCPNEILLVLASKCPILQRLVIAIVH